MAWSDTAVGEGDVKWQVNDFRGFGRDLRGGLGVLRMS